MKTVRTWCIRILMILFTVIFLYPLFWNLMSAFKTNAEYLTDPYALPAALNLDNFVAAWQKANIAAYFGNSIFVIPISYVLARYRFVGSRLISTVYMACIFLQATYIMIPLFLELQAVNGLSNLPVLCLVYAVMQFPFCIFTLQGFMSAVPRDYEESARIDGATNIQLLLRVMVPLAKPGIATITMLSAMGFWNEYPLALVLLTEDAKKTLPIGMANLFEVQKYATDWGALFAGLVIVMIPTIIIYLIGQRYLLQGIGAGGLKG